MGKNIVIKSLQKYLDVIEKYPSDNFWFRGENEQFKNRDAGAFRLYQNDSFKGHIFPFIQMKDEFYREIAYKLNNVDRQDFLAFAQHYGIPTNLLDMSEAPLISLFFACQENKEQVDKGYVFLFERSKYIDITQLIQENSNINVIQEIFMNNNEELFVKLYSYFDEYSKQKTAEFSFFYKRLLAEIVLFLKENKKKLFPRLPNELWGLFSSKNKRNLDDLLKKHFETSSFFARKLFNNVDANVSVLNYMFLIQAFFKLIRKSGVQNHPTISFLPKLLYQPTLTFERGMLQRGSFFFQAYCSYRDKVTDNHLLLKQDIQSDGCLEIHNRKSILQSLDNIGINIKTIFADYDNIALYIRRKYLRKMEAKQTLCK